MRKDYLNQKASPFYRTVDWLFAETGAKRLILIDPETGAREVVAEKLRIGLPSMMGGSGPYLPTGIATDSHGAIYMTSDFDHTVLKFTPR